MSSEHANAGMDSGLTWREIMMSIRRRGCWATCFTAVTTRGSPSTPMTRVPTDKEPKSA